jgi:hypothetical protein
MPRAGSTGAPPSSTRSAGSHSRSSTMPVG